MSFKFNLDSVTQGVSQGVIDNAENAIGLGWVTDLLARKGSMTALAKAHPLTREYVLEHEAELKNMLGLEQMEPQLRTLLQAMLAAHKATIAAEEANAAAEKAREEAAPVLVADGKEESKEYSKEAAEAAKAAAAEAAEAVKASAETSAVADRKVLAAHFDFSSVPENKGGWDTNLERDSMVKDMLVAVLNEDKSAFKKAFALFESEKCKEDPNNYVKGLGNADEAYNAAASDTFSDVHLGEKGLVEELADSPLSDEDFLQALTSVRTKVKDTLDAQNKVQPSNLETTEPSSASDEDKATDKKINAENSKRAAAFVNKAMQDEFAECKSERKQAQDDLKEAKKTQTAAVLSSTEGKVNYAIAYVKSIFFTLSATEQTAVEKAEMDLKAAQKNLDTAKAARGWVFGFYLTPDFKSLIGKKFEDSLSKKTHSKKTQLENALGCTQAKEVPGTSTLESIASSFVGAVSAVKSFPGKVGGLFATAWESFTSMFKAAPLSKEEAAVKIQARFRLRKRSVAAAERQSGAKIESVELPFSADGAGAADREAPGAGAGAEAGAEDREAPGAGEAEAAKQSGVTTPVSSSNLQAAAEGAPSVLEGGNVGDGAALRSLFQEGSGVGTSGPASGGGSM